MKKCIRRNVTLIEVMIVMFLIALIIGALAYNYQGAFDKGKAFKTETGMKRLEEILTLSISERPELEDDIESNWKTTLKNSPLVQNPDSLIKDGWGQEYQVRYEDGRIIVTSRRYEEYRQRTSK